MTFIKKGNLVNQLVVLRAEKGWTQKEVADQVGVSRQTIISLEANRYTPSLTLAFEIAHLFGKRVDEVFQYINKEEQL